MYEEMPDYAMIPVTEKPVKLIPANDDIKSNRLKITQLNRLEIPNLITEEDILVPDTKQDLDKIINVTATVEITRYEEITPGKEKEILRVSGFSNVSTLYVPLENSNTVVSISSRIPFRYECENPAQKGNAIGISANVLSIDAKVVNERKIRIALEAELKATEYNETEIEFMEGVRDESLYMKKEKIRFSDITQRRTDTTNIREKIKMKDGDIPAGKIVKYDINIVEKYHQISKGRGVIEAIAYYSILYLPEETTEEQETSREPVFYRGKSEFTQFMKLPDTLIGEIAGSIVSFKVESANIEIRHGNEPIEKETVEETGNGASSDNRSNSTESPNGTSGFNGGTGATSGNSLNAGETDSDNNPWLLLDLTVATSIEVYRNIEKDIVTDMYHRNKNLEFSTVPYQISELCGMTSADIFMRDTANITDDKGQLNTAIYMSAEPYAVRTQLHAGVCDIEGKAKIKIVYTEAESGNISWNEEIVPFKTSIEIDGINDDSQIDCEIDLKEFWFERVNSHQIEYNCNLLLRAYAWNIKLYEFIDKVCYIESENEVEAPSMVLYMAKEGDSQWSIAKEFRTTVESLREINNLPDDGMIKTGSCLLIV